MALLVVGTAAWVHLLVLLTVEGAWTRLLIFLTVKTTAGVHLLSFLSIQIALTGTSSCGTRRLLPLIVHERSVVRTCHWTLLILVGRRLTGLRLTLLEIVAALGLS